MPNGQSLTLGMIGVYGSGVYNDLSKLGSNSPLDLEALRARLRKMPDAELLRFGKSCAFICTPAQNFGKPAPEAG